MQRTLVGRTERVVLADDGRVGRDLADGEGGDSNESSGELHCEDGCIEPLVSGLYLRGKK